MASKTLKLGDIVFKNKTTAEKEIKNLLHSVKVKEDEYVELDKNMFCVLRDVLAMHPRIEEKIPNFPSELEKIVIGNTFGCNHFCYVLNGSPPEPFSYKKCFAAKSSYHKTCVIGALRALVIEQGKEYKKKYINGKDTAQCELSGLIFPSSDMVVDHYIPFVDIFKNFCKKYNINIQDIEIEYKDNCFNTINTIADERIRQLFYDYHKENAKFCVINKELNSLLSDMKKEGPVFEYAVKSFIKKHVFA